MKIINNITALLFGSLLIVLTGCDENSFSQIVIIDLPDHESALSINSHITADGDSIGVYVSHSLATLDTSSYKLIGDAKVELYKNGNFLHELPPNGSRGFYQKLGVEPVGEEIATYRLEVTAPNYKAVMAEQTMPRPIKISKLEFVKDAALNGDGEKADELRITIDDYPGEENFYVFNVYFEPDPDNVDGGYSYGIYSEDLFVEYSEVGDLLRDATFDGQSYILRFVSYNGDEYEPKPGDKIRINASAVTKDRYLYERTKAIYKDSQGNPFSEPVVVHENIKDGHGIFSLGVNVEKFYEF